MSLREVEKEAIKDRLLAVERNARDRYADGEYERGEMMAAHAARMEMVADQAKAERRAAESQLAAVREWAEKVRTLEMLVLVNNAEDEVAQARLAAANHLLRLLDK